MCKSTYGLAHSPACVTDIKWMNGDGKLLYFFFDYFVSETCRSNVCGSTCCSICKGLFAIQAALKAHAQAGPAAASEAGTLLKPTDSHLPHWVRGSPSGYHQTRGACIQSCAHAFPAAASGGLRVTFLPLRAQKISPGS